MPEFMQDAFTSLSPILAFIVIVIYLLIPIVSGWLAYRYRLGLKRVEDALDSEKHEREKERLSMQNKIIETKGDATDKILSLKNEHERRMEEIRNDADVQKGQQIFSEKLLEHLAEMSSQNRVQHESFINSNKEMIGAINTLGDRTISAASTMEAAVERDNRKLHASLDDLPISISKTLEETLTPMITQFVSSKASAVSDAVKSAVDEHEARAQERHEGLHSKVISLEERITRIETRLNGDAA